MIDSKIPLLDSQSSSESEPPSQMADTSADRLMNELFDDVERALEGDVEALERRAQPAIAEPDPESELTLSFTEGGLPAVLLDQSVVAETSGDLAPFSTALAPPLAAQPEVADEASAAMPIAQQRRRFWTLNQTLLGAAGLTLLATFGLWLYQRQAVEVAVPAAVPVPADVPVADVNAEFLEYLRRSLDVIAQNAANTNPTTAGVGDVAIALNNGGNGGLPPVGNNVLPPGAPAGLPSAPGSVNVIERVYVPYPSSQVARAAPAVPNQTSSAPTSATAPAAASSTARPNAHTLLGVLELGERSAALFEIDGVPQRVYIGERVGNSGWSLVSVANEEAVVRRNGEVRTLYIGQQF